MIIEGFLAIKNCIEANKRTIKHLYFKEDIFEAKLNYLKHLAHKLNIDFSYKDSTFFKSYPKSGGVIADVLEREYNDLIDGDILVLNGLSDPYNIAYLIRLAACYNLAVIFDLKSFDESILIKSSCGLIDKIPVKRTLDLKSELAKYKNHRLIALNRSANAKTIDHLELATKNILIVGGEKRGINKKILELCDSEYYLNYQSLEKIALPSVVAASMMVTYYDQRSNQIKR